MLRAFLHKLAAGYPFVVVDNEAGMEHLSRRTDDRVDLMLVVGDPTPTGLKSAERIGRLAAQMGVVRGRMGLVVNRIAGAPAGPEAAAATGLPLMGWIPEDPLVAEFERRSQPLLTLPAASAAAAAVDALLRDLGV
jgi:CO dehydrogenase maturation factor